MHRLGRQLLGRIDTWNDDPRTDISQFARDRLGQSWRPGLLAGEDLLRIVSPNNTVVGVCRSGQVHIVDVGMIHQGLAYLRVTFDGHEQTFLKKRCKGSFKNRL